VKHDSGVMRSLSRGTLYFEGLWLAPGNVALPVSRLREPLGGHRVAPAPRRPLGGFGPSVSFGEIQLLLFLEGWVGDPKGDRKGGGGEWADVLWTVRAARPQF